MTFKLAAQESVCWEGAFQEAGQRGQRPLVGRGMVREHRGPGCLEKSRRGQGAERCGQELRTWNLVDQRLEFYPQQKATGALTWAWHNPIFVSKGSLWTSGTGRRSLEDAFRRCCSDAGRTRCVLSQEAFLHPHTGGRAPPDRHIPRVDLLVSLVRLKAGLAGPSVQGAYLL